MAPNTAPSITAGADSGWEAVVQGLNGHLQTFNSAGVFTDTLLGMEPGTSPSITPVP